MRPGKAALTAWVACNAPGTVIDSMVISTSSGVTSGFRLVKPSTRICNVWPAARTASRSVPENCYKPSTSILRAIACLRVIFLTPPV